MSDIRSFCDEQLLCDSMWVWRMSWHPDQGGDLEHDSYQGENEVPDLWKQCMIVNWQKNGQSIFWMVRQSSCFFVKSISIVSYAPEFGGILNILLWN